MSISRRDFLSATLLAPALARLQPVSAGRFIANIPFGSPGAPTTPLERLLGAGLDARLFSDLSKLAPDALVTPADRFFIRTVAPPALPDRAAWKLELAASGAESSTLDLASLERLEHASGRYLLECAGNADPANFGLMSVADWEGISLASILERLRAPSASAVLVSGIDWENAQQTSRTSLPGASWIFPADALSRALLATHMNGAPLPANHGAPVRLVVPGWYGCACIKWVNRIALVVGDAAPTSQMWEFAARTHQIGPPALARDYTPAIIDTAAVPVRIEKWSVEGRTEYRVVGIIWGGEQPTNALAIRFRARDSWVPVERCARPESTRTWSLWTHTWRPSEPGRYEIVLKITDPAIRTRRLDLFYYTRSVEIDGS